MKETLERLLALYDTKKETKDLLDKIKLLQEIGIKVESVSINGSKIILDSDLQKTIESLLVDYNKEKLKRIEREIASYKIITCSINRENKDEW